MKATFFLAFFFLFINISNAQSHRHYKSNKKNIKKHIQYNCKTHKNNVWVEGYFKFNKKRNKFIWVNGYWKNKFKKVWIPGYWIISHRGKVWVSGYWIV